MSRMKPHLGTTSGGGGRRGEQRERSGGVKFRTSFSNTVGPNPGGRGGGRRG